MIVTDNLDPSLNPATFQLTSIGWGDFVLSIPSGSQTFQDTVPMTYNGETFDVVVSAGIDYATDQIYAKFYSIDPATQLPPDALTGFLPAEDGTGRGEGFISYSVSPKLDLPTGTQIRNVADISFDQQPIITTDQVNDEDPSQGVNPNLQDLVTIDSVAPTSSVSPLPATTTSTQFTVNWSGSDDQGGSGIADYTIYVSFDNGPYTIWLDDTTETSATYKAESGPGTYSFISQATDNVGNVEPFHTKADTTIQVSSALTVTSVAEVTPNPRNAPVSSVEVTFSETVNTSSFSAAALSLTDNGQPVTISGGLSLTLVSGTTYQVNGLSAFTAAEGSYTLTISAADVKDASGNFGSGSVSTSWLMDTTPPTSSVQALAKTGTSLSFPVTVTGSDPNGANGSTGSGIASFTIYDSVNGGAWQKWTTITAVNSSATATFTGQSSTTYTFYSTATDAAGNAQAYKPSIEASTYLPDLTPPTASVSSTSTYASDGLFTLSLTGTDPGGSVLTYFEVFAEVGAGGFAQVGPAIPAGVASSSGVYQATATFLSPASFGVSNSYKFYAIGIDAAGQQGSSATAPITGFTNVAFQQPSSLQVEGLTVEDGAAERSYIRYLTINFNEADAGVLQAMAGSSSDVTLTQNNLNDNGTPTAVSLQPGMMTVSGNTIQIDFGAAGLDGSPNTTTANGYYTLDVTIPGGSTTALHFYRLLGDVTGDGVVNNSDLTAISGLLDQSAPSGFVPLNSDVNGDGSVTAMDSTLATRSKGQELNPSLLGSLATPGVIVAAPAAMLSSFGAATPAGGFNLVQAITTDEQDANASDTIDVPPGDYPVPDLVMQTLNSSVPHKTLTIVGTGSSPAQTVADGSGSSRVFQITSSITVIFKDMAIEHGKATDGGNLGGTTALGGGVLIDGGQATMSSVSVNSNSASAQRRPGQGRRPGEDRRHRRRGRRRQGWRHLRGLGHARFEQCHRRQ